jgi:hypothetical protein
MYSMCVCARARVRACVCVRVTSSMLRCRDIVPRTIFKRLCQLLPREYPYCTSEHVNDVADAM